tara:strand:+ start:1941 stop:2204 length:264 start_codon:yes stop_codon:yes gene_type:complete
MKIFFYKSILIFFLFIVAFHFTFGIASKNIKRQMQETLSKESVEKVKNQIRDEMENAVKKDRYISSEDAKLINKFLNKIKTDLEKSK